MTFSIRASVILTFLIHSVRFVQAYTRSVVSDPAGLMRIPLINLIVAESFKW